MPSGDHGIHEILTIQAKGHISPQDRPNASNGGYHFSRHREYAVARIVESLID